MSTRNATQTNKCRLDEAARLAADLLKQKILASEIAEEEKNYRLNLVKELLSFDLGKSLIAYRALSGPWTDYVIQSHDKEKISSDLERFIIEKAPSALATRERFYIFLNQTQKLCQNNTSMASVPCGVMSDLLQLNFENIDKAHLIGVDIDPVSLGIAESKIQNLKEGIKGTLLQQDAYALQLPDPVDVILSNGLNIYQPDNEKVVTLYKQFFDNLKPGGTLITSFLTPPPTSGHCLWNMSTINLKHLALQKAIFIDLLESQWNVFRSEKEIFSQLEEAGFEAIELHPDKAFLFPTVIAKKPQT